MDETAVVFQESCGAFKYRKFVLFDVDFEEQRLIRNRKKIIEPNRLDFDDILFPGPSHMRATGGDVNIQHEPELSVDVSHGKKVRAYHVGLLVEIEVSRKMMEVTDVGFKSQDFRDFWVASQKHCVIPEIRANIEEDIAAMPFGLVCEIAQMLPIVAADQSHMPVDMVTIIDKEKCTRDTDNLIPTLPCDSDAGTGHVVASIAWEKARVGTDDPDSFMFAASGRRAAFSIIVYPVEREENRP